MDLKATGIVRKVDELGRVVIPKELRRTLSINDGDPLEIFVSDVGIVLRPYRVGCLACGEMDGVVKVNGVVLCPTCIQMFAENPGSGLVKKGAVQNENR